MIIVPGACWSTLTVSAIGASVPRALDSARRGHTWWSEGSTWRVAAGRDGRRSTGPGYEAPGPEVT